jgi:hypothetical protein
MRPSRLLSLALVAWIATVAGATEPDAGVLVYRNAFGHMATFSTAGAIDQTNPFFADLGTNGRTCATCHQPDSAWSITPENVQRRFRQSHGQDPIFSSNDGSNCEGALAVRPRDQQQAYSLLLTRALIRVGFDVPVNAEFTVEDVHDPYHCGPGTNQVSVYRRPLPAANLTFLSAVMWDGRESTAARSIEEDLLHQANDATRGHAEAARDLTPEEASDIVRFETSLFAAQIRDRVAGRLDARGATGGPLSLSAQPFFIGINDPIGLNPTGAAFDARVFTLFDAWLAPPAAFARTPAAERRQAIARGQEVFNTKQIVLSGVSGLNGETFPNGVHLGDTVVGSCTLCHDAPNAGDHSVKAPLNIGVTDPDVAPYLPVYTLRNLSTGETVRTTDPGRALITGRWADVGRFKGPVLRGLAARAPYFHNGSAATLEDVLDFYERRFHMGLTAQERADLLAFLRSL